MLRNIKVKIGHLTVNFLSCGGRYLHRWTLSIRCKLLSVNVISKFTNTACKDYHDCYIFTPLCTGAVLFVSQVETAVFI